MSKEGNPVIFDVFVGYTNGKNLDIRGDQVPVSIGYGLSGDETKLAIQDMKEKIEGIMTELHPQAVIVKSFVADEERVYRNDN